MTPLRTRGRKSTVPIHALRRRLEALEDRAVPATLSVADVTVREGPALTGILDPAGAAAVGLNGVTGIARNDQMSHPHAGDLFMAGQLSHSVARFDWETQTYQPFVAPGSAGLAAPYSVIVGADGDVYVSDRTLKAILRFDGSSGAPKPADGQTGAVFVPAGSGGLVTPHGIAFGADGNLYVCNRSPNLAENIVAYQGPAGSSPGAFVRVFADITNGSGPHALAFGPDGNLYVSLINNRNGTIGQVNRYDGSTGAPIGTGVFIPQIIQPRGIAFDEQGDMYVIQKLTGNGYDTLPGPNGQVLRFQGPNGQNPGTLIEPFVTGGQGGLVAPESNLFRDASGNLYVGEHDNANVKRFAPGSLATFVVTLDAASGSSVSVDFATTAVTAAAGGDFTAASGTLAFAPGETTKTVSVPITDNLTGEPTETFRLNLSNAANATIADGQGIGTILDNETKFFAVDSGTVNRTFEYGSGGTSEEITVPQSSTNTAPRGAAATVAGTTVWVVDANRTVYVYDNHGLRLGFWAAGGLSGQAQVEGITVWGNDVWLVDAKQDRVYRYAGAASRLSGSQNAASNFALNSANKDPKDLVTDGTSLWVVNDSTADKVFKYTLSGTLLGSWTMTGGGGSPTGITLDPSAPAHLWVVDNAADRVYQFDNAVGRTSGSQAASASFALNPFNTNPQGIADPPTVGIDDATATEGNTAIRLVDRFVAEGSGGIVDPGFLEFGPDVNQDGVADLYVAGTKSDAVHRYDGRTGAPIDTFVAPGSGGLDNPRGLAFGPDGHLYVSSNFTNQILRYDGASGAFLGAVANVVTPTGITFGSDGYLYIANMDMSQVLRYRDGILSEFVTAGSGGLSGAIWPQFGPDGNGDGTPELYVTSRISGQVLRYDGQTGAFIDVFASRLPGQAGMGAVRFTADGYLYTTPRTATVGTATSINRYSAATGAFIDSIALGRDGWCIAIGPDGLIYDSSNGGNNFNFVERFGPRSLAAFTVRLDAPATTPVTVQFATADLMALADSDYVAANGTLTFAPGQTTRTILVRTLDDARSEQTENFTVNLSNPAGATIVDGQAVGLILDNEPPLPHVARVDANGPGVAQRSRVMSVTVTFDDLVTFAVPVAEAFTLTRIGGGPVGSFTATATIAANGVTVVTLSNFGGAETQFGSLADGRYALTVRANQVSSGGQPLDGNGDGVGGDDYTLNGTVANGLYRLYGDANGDGFVNAADFGPFRNAFGSSVGQSAYLDYLDLNGDGVINAFDFAQFRSRFGSSVP